MTTATNIVNDDPASQAGYHLTYQKYQWAPLIKRAKKIVSIKKTLMTGQTNMLDWHQWIKTGAIKRSFQIQSFQCEKCDRTFLRNDHLKSHQIVHNNDLPDGSKNAMLLTIEYIFQPWSHLFILGEETVKRQWKWFLCENRVKLWPKLRSLNEEKEEITDWLMD